MVKSDLIGEVYGILTVTKKTDLRTKDKKVIWECLCECGNTYTATSSNLKSKIKGIKSCGCLLPGSRANNYSPIDLVGEVFGRLTVLNFSHTNNHKNRVWECLCTCGNKCYVVTANLNQKITKSCGCLSIRNRRGAEVYNYSGYEDITGTKWNSITHGAKTRNLEFSITKEDVWSMFLKQKELCALSNLSISFKEGTASVDRIDSLKGYTINNIQLVHKHINKIKMDFNVEYFIELCTLVSEYNKTK